MKRRKTQSRRFGHGSIGIITALLVTSATIRLATSADFAMANAELPQGTEDAEKGEQAAWSTEASSGASPSRPEMRTLLTALKEREERVSEAEAQINMRKKALEVADREITKRLETLEKAEQQLRSTLALADSAAENDLARLTTVYENMKPKDVAALFETMEPDFAAGFLGRMRPDAAAAVFAGLTPEKAYSISAILAGRNANVPKS